MEQGWEGERRRGCVLCSFGRRATQDGLKNRLCGFLSIVDTLEGSLGGGNNACVGSINRFSDDGFEGGLWGGKVMREIQA